MKQCVTIPVKVAVLLIALTFLSACTTKIVSRPATDRAHNVGIAYHLPATELTYAMTFRLASCRGAIDIVDAAILQRAVPDRGAGTYLIDSAGLGNLSKTIPMAKFTLENGMLASLSYDAKDNTAGIIKGGADLLGAVASGLSPIKLPALDGALALLAGSRSLRQDQLVRSFQPQGSPQGAKGEDRGICNEATQHILDEYHLLQQHLSAMKRKLYDAERLLAERQDGMAAQIQELEKVIVRTKERLSALEGHLTLQYRRVLPVEAGKCEHFGDIVLESTPFAKWFGPDDQSAFHKQFQAWVEENKLSYTIGSCQGLAKSPEKEMAGVEGLYYRMPARCKLEITKDTLVSTSDVELMQCGRLAAVEITNGAFQDNSHRIEFDPLSGEIKLFEFKDNTVRTAQALGGITGAVKADKP